MDLGWAAPEENKPGVHFGSGDFRELEQMKVRSRLYQAFRPAMPAFLRDMIDLRLVKEAYPNDSGWTRSRREAIPVDANGFPIPWYTYPAIRFLAERVPATTSVFEFGMGYSTLWWSERADRVLACEHDQSWFDRMSSLLPANAGAVIYPVDDRHYVRAATDAGETFDVIVIDGRRRVECARHSLDCLSPSGVIVWDNSDRDRYDEGYSYLQSNGFRRIDFWGMGPLIVTQWCTSIFYRPNNCLGI